MKYIFEMSNVEGGQFKPYTCRLTLVLSTSLLFLQDFTEMTRYCVRFGIKVGIYKYIV